MARAMSINLHIIDGNEALGPSIRQEIEKTAHGKKTDYTLDL